MKSKRLSAAAAAVCLLAALMMGVSTAYAAGELPEDGTNTLTITPIDTTDEAILADIPTADIVVDVYQIGTATPKEAGGAYDYKLVAPFNSLTIFNADQATAEMWVALAESSAKLVTADMKHLTVPADGATALSLPADGLYLILPHGSKANLDYGDKILDSLVASGDAYDYAFLTSVVVAPTKETSDGTVSNVSSSGTWTRDIKITIKPECTPVKVIPPSPPAETGDATNLFPYYVIMALSGLALVVLVVTGLRRRKQ